jgi:hypothetical protein
LVVDVEVGVHEGDVFLDAARPGSTFVGAVILMTRSIPSRLICSPESSVAAAACRGMPRARGRPKMRP